MDYCGPAGIPHSQFLEWDPDDRDKALWWVIHQREACPACGTRAEEWEHDDHAYTAEPKHCRGCEVRARAEEDLDKHRDEYRRGTSVALTRREP